MMTDSTATDIPSYRKVAPIKIPPPTDKKINPKKIFEGIDVKTKPKGEEKPKRRKQKKNRAKRDLSRK